MRKEKGITLVALVVTIIVLIILAGISINLVLGDNGIITIAQKAKENIELAKIEEETELNELYTQLEINGSDSSSSGTTYDAIAKITEFKTAIANAIEEAGGTKTDTTAETTVFADNIKGILNSSNTNYYEFGCGQFTAMVENGNLSLSTEYVYEAYNSNNCWWYFGKLMKSFTNYDKHPIALVDCHGYVVTRGSAYGGLYNNVTVTPFSLNAGETLSYTGTIQYYLAFEGL